MSLSKELFYVLIDQSWSFRKFVFENVALRVMRMADQTGGSAPYRTGQRLALSLLEEARLTGPDRARLESIATHGIAMH
jgi:hypothetical protein